jgi:hypothetical protein
MGRGSATTAATTAGTPTRGGARAAKPQLTLTGSAVVPALDIDFHYALDYDQLEYEESSDCSAAGCAGICRCRRISDARVVGTVPPWVISQSLLKAYQEQAQRQWQAAQRRKNPKSRRQVTVAISELDQAGMEWIVRAQKITGDAFEVNVGAGYYGDEIEEVHMYSDGIDKLAREYLSLPDDAGERLRWLLGQHGSSSSVIDHAQVSLTRLPLNQLVSQTRNRTLPNPDHNPYTEISDQIGQNWTTPIVAVTKDQGQLQVIEGAEWLEGLSWTTVPVWLAEI